VVPLRVREADRGRLHEWPAPSSGLPVTPAS
jgi:hypothetical protein